MDELESNGSDDRVQKNVKCTVKFCDHSKIQIQRKTRTKNFKWVKWKITIFAHEKNVFNAKNGNHIRSCFLGAKNRDVQKMKTIDLTHLKNSRYRKSKLFKGKPMPTRPPLVRGPEDCRQKRSGESVFPLAETKFSFGEFKLPLAETKFPLGELTFP